MLTMLCSALLLIPSLLQEEGKTLITSLEELPRRTYELPVTFDELVDAPDEQRILAASLRKDMAADLTRYEFAEASLAREFHSRMLQVDLVLLRLDEALDDIRAMRRLSDSEALKHASALHAEAWIRALQRVGHVKTGYESDQLEGIYAKALQSIMSALPKEAVRGEIARKRMKLSMATERMLRMIISRIKADLPDDGTIDAASAFTLLSMCNALSFLPLRDVTVEIYGDYLRKKEAKARTPIMIERQVALQRTDRAEPVVIAIWDTGVDVTVFADRLFSNPGERMDGTDTDGNGYVDDLNGIAFGRGLKPVQGLLLPIELGEDERIRVKKCMKGVEDIQTGFDSPEAAMVQELFDTLETEERRALGRKVKRHDIYCHGTHVAGIAAKGNPFARILTVRVSFDDEALKTEEWARAFAGMCRDSVAYFKASGVRVANLSWGWDVHEIEANLKTHGEGDHAGEKAAKIFGILEEGLRDAMESAPEILFVNGAGDAAGDPDNYRWIPGIFDLPNVIAVGAVNEYGEVTPFSSHGSHVRLLANGFHVDSFIPGGERMRLSGTSMAAPQATNVAAKLLALDDSLSPAEVIALLLEGGEEVNRDGRMYILLNPEESVKRLRDR